MVAAEPSRASATAKLHHRYGDKVRALQKGFVKKKQARQAIDPRAKSVLSAWFCRHVTWPYPSVRRGGRGLKLEW